MISVLVSSVVYRGLFNAKWTIVLPKDDDENGRFVLDQNAY
jgi:hypothetical protein